MMKEEASETAASLARPPTTGDLGSSATNHHAGQEWVVGHLTQQYGGLRQKKPLFDA